MLLGDKPINPICTVVKGVEREVVIDNGEYQYRARYSQRQARDIDDGIGKRSGNIPEGDLEIIS